MHARNTRQTLFWMVVAALALRLVVMLFVYQQNLDPHLDHWRFGFEEGRVAQAIATGRGFSNPLYAPTGPTAWMTPVYPYILAGVFKVFGVFSTASALVILTFNAITSALTCIPIFLFARKSFGEGVGKLAGWIWAVFPYAIYWPVERIWDTWLATLLLAILFWITLELAESSRTRDWIAFGALSGFAALIDPAVMAVLPFLALWVLWRLRAKFKTYRFAMNQTTKTSSSPPSAAAAGLGRTAKRRAATRLFLCATGCLLATILVVSPWFVRNYRVFHKFIPFRDNFGLALRVGNIGDTRDTITLQAGPWLNAAEWREYQKDGEIVYMQEKGRAARMYIASHRREYILACIRRAIFVWTDFWNLSSEYLLGYPIQPAGVALYIGLSILTFIGLRNAFREDPAIATPYAIVLVFFPLIYYLTSVEWWYRVPMDPMIVALAAYAITSRPESQAPQSWPSRNFENAGDAPGKQRRNSCCARFVSAAIIYLHCVGQTLAWTACASAHSEYKVPQAPQNRLRGIHGENASLQ